MANAHVLTNTKSFRRSARRWFRTLLGILVGAGLAAGLRASLTTDRVLVAADWDGDPSVVPLAAGFINPSSTSSALDRNRRVVWAPVPGAEAYKLVVGTAAGAADVFDSGPLFATSYELPGTLPTTGVLYARLWTKVGGVWRAKDASRRVTDITFTLTSQSSANQAAVPPLGQPE